MSWDMLAVLTRVGAAPLVGRNAELALLRERLAAVAHSPGAVIVLCGEPGAGKTRLAAEMAQESRAQAVRVVALRCYEQTRTLPYAPFLDPAAELPKVAALLTDVPPASGARLLDGVRIGLFEEVDRTLLDIAGSATLLLLVDDLHWADAASLDLLHHLARRGRRGSRAIVTTIRADERPASSPVGILLADLAREGLLLDLPLPPLDRAACDTFLAELLGPTDPMLARVIYERTEGLPFFVEELLRLLVSDGYARCEHGVWRLVEVQDPAELPVPPGIAATVLRRVAALPPETHSALAAAAALGARCSLTLLAHIHQRPQQALMEDLAPAVAARLLRVHQQTGPNGGPEYAFAHILARDAIYAELAPQDRRTLHMRIAYALAAMEPATSATLVAYHAERGHEWQLAFEASLAAGDAAVRALAGAEALAFFRNACALADMGYVAPLPSERLALDQRIVATLMGLGHVTETATAARGLIARAPVVGDRAAEARAWIYLGQAETFAHHRDEAQRALDRACTLAEELQDDALLAMALANTSVLLEKYDALDEAAAHMRRALPLAEKVGDRITALDGLSCLGYVATWRGDFAAGAAHFLEARTLAEQAHNAFALANARFGLSLALAGRGEYEAALAELQLLLEFAAVTGEASYATRAPSTIGWVYRELALVERALTWDERAVAESAQGDWPGLFEARANSLLNLAADLTLLGRLEEAGATLDRAAAATERNEFTRGRNTIQLAFYRGELALARGDAKTALLLATEAQAQAEPKHYVRFDTLARGLAGRALAALGRHEESATRLEQGTTLATSIGYRAGSWRMALALAETLDRLGRGGEARLWRSRARATVDEVAASLRDHELRTAFLAATRTFLASAAPAMSAASPAATPHLRGLSGREVEVLHLVARGMSNRDIARVLTLSEHTVNSHLVHIFNKLGVNNRAAAATIAARLGLTS